MVKSCTDLEPKKSLLVGGGDRPNLMLAQVQVFCPGPGPGPGQDLSGTGP